MTGNINVKLTAEIENIEEIEETIAKLKSQLKNINIGFAVEDGDSPRIVQGMKIIRANRGAGKTTELIKQSSAEGKHIICHSRNAVLYIEDLARQMERWIPKPMTVGDLQRSRRLKDNYKTGVKSMEKLNIKEFEHFRIVGNDNLFKIVDGKGYYLEDYDKNNIWRYSPTITDYLESGEYKIEI